MSENIRERYELLKAMNTVVKLMNDEGAYMQWIYIIPDEADDEELYDCAVDEEIMQDACKCFNTIIRSYGKSGGYYADGKVFG